MNEMVIAQNAKDSIALKGTSVEKGKVTPNHANPN